MATPNDQLCKAARDGRHDLCQLAKDQGADDFNRMLLGASQGGHRDICQLAKDWGATYFYWMLCEALIAIAG